MHSITTHNSAFSGLCISLKQGLLMSLFMGLFIGLLGGCASQPDQPAVSGESEPLAKPLEASSWTAELIFDQNANAAQSTVIFVDDDTISGSTGCNNYNGAVELAGASINVGLLATTRMMCEPAISGQETVFLEALGAARNWQLIGSTLDLTDEKNIRVMRLTRNTD
jgi:heat shock protein HslJ